MKKPGMKIRQGNMAIQMIATIITTIILLLIAFPSLKCLYLLEEWNNPLISIDWINYFYYGFINIHNN